MNGLLRRIDLLLAVPLLALAGLAAWTLAPVAIGASATDQLRIDLEVPTLVAVTPGWTAGDASVRMPAAGLPGSSNDATSGGWRMQTNANFGYEVRLRSTTSPAMRGANAVDGHGARSSFSDFRTGTGCPCPWTVDGFDSGVFGYSVSVDTVRGAAARDVEQWGSAANGRRWRGLTQDGWRAYSTPPGAGAYSMTLHFRTAIPRGGVQTAGSYRASVVASVHPLV